MIRRYAEHCVCRRNNHPPPRSAAPLFQGHELSSTDDPCFDCQAPQAFVFFRCEPLAQEWAHCCVLPGNGDNTQPVDNMTPPYGLLTLIMKISTTLVTVEGPRGLGFERSPRFLTAAAY